MKARGPGSIIVIAATAALLLGATAVQPARAASPPRLELTLPAQAPIQEARDVESDADGNLYVLLVANDTSNSLEHLVKVSPTGEVLWAIGGRGSAPGQFDSPQGVAIGNAGRIYVVERGTHRVQYFRASDGQYLGSFGSRCMLPSDSFNDCRDPDGPGPLELGDGEFFQPLDIATDAAGRIYVVDFNNHRVQVLDRKSVV